MCRVKERKLTWVVRSYRSVVRIVELKLSATRSVLSRLRISGSVMSRLRIVWGTYRAPNHWTFYK